MACFQSHYMLNPMSLLMLMRNLAALKTTVCVHWTKDPAHLSSLTAQPDPHSIAEGREKEFDVVNSVFSCWLNMILCHGIVPSNCKDSIFRSHSNPMTVTTARGAEFNLCNFVRDHIHWHCPETRDHVMTSSHVKATAEQLRLARTSASNLMALTMLSARRAEFNQSINQSVNFYCLEDPTGGHTDNVKKDSVLTITKIHTFAYSDGFTWHAIHQKMSSV